MITIFAPFADRLNLNGDQGNVLVLTKFFEAAKVDCQVVSNFQQLNGKRPDFVFLGHGSDAAMRSIDAELVAQRHALVDFQSTVPGLVVGSSVVWLVEQGLSAQVKKPGAQESRFEVAKIENLRVLGYRNTDSGLDSLAQTGKWIESMLHGPVLAKNPALLSMVAARILEVANLAMPVAETAEWMSQLNRISAEIWSVETDEEFEPAN